MSDNEHVMSDNEHEATGQEPTVPAEAGVVAGQEPAAQEPTGPTEPTEPTGAAAAPEAEVPSPGPSAPAAPKPSRPTTGDTVVDQALEEFDRVTGEPLDTHIEVGERVHRTLQGRLADIGDE